MCAYLKICILLLLTSFTESKIHGVADKDIHLYESEELKCPSNGKKLTVEMINDGRCDCPDDGFDEPGTAACENGRFFCKNAKDLEQHIPSFKVNDGVCDCCDGSDEYLDNFGIKCQNTCDILKSNQRRAAYLEKAKIAKAKKYYEKNKIEAKIKQNELKEKLAEINRKLLEISEKSEAINENNSSTESIETFLSEYRQKLDQLEVLIANLTITDNFKSSSTNDKHATAAPNQNSQNSWKTLIDMRLKRVKDIISRLTPLSSTKATVTVTKYLPTVVTKTIVQYEPTSSFEDKYQDMDYEKDELLTQVREIEESLRNPELYGPDSVFLAMKDKCFDSEDGGFNYSLCWFDEVKQDSHMLIGKWNGEWGEAIDKDDNTVRNYKHMIYRNGNWCGSKARETHVHLQCGWSDKIISVSESSTCVYVFKFSTPLACGDTPVIHPAMTKIRVEQEEFSSASGSEIDQLNDEFDDDAVFEDSVSEISEAEEQEESEVETSETVPKAKKQKKTFNPDALANAFQSVLRQNLPNNSMEKTNEESDDEESVEERESESVTILAKSKAINDLEEAQIDYRARKILKAQIRSAQEAVHFPIANAPETLNFERSLRKLATRGVVQLFNAIQAGQQQKDEEKRLKRQEKLAEAQRNLPLLGKESSVPFSSSSTPSSSASYFDFLKQQQQKAL